MKRVDYSGGNHEMASPVQLNRSEVQILQRAESPAVRSVMILSSDPVVTIGLHSVVKQQGVTVITADVEASFSTSFYARWASDAVILGDTGIAGDHDRYRALSGLARREDAGQIPVIACVGRGAETELQRLRMVEAGVSILLPLVDLAAGWRSLLTSGVGERVEGRGRLPDGRVLRGRLGLSEGSIARFLTEVEAIAPEWAVAHSGTRDRPELTRTQIRKLREAALGQGGLPPPDPERYSTVLRRAPSLPNWPTVRGAILELWGHAPR